MKFLFAVISLSLMALTSCDNTSKSQKKHINEAQVKEAFIEINKAYIEVEDRQIDDYLNRRQWNFNRTQSGLRYLIYKQGVGNGIATESVVRIEYTVSLIRGEVLYSSATDGDKVIVVDKTEEPSGLHEALHLMKVGDRAKLVIPSYLAYGLLGDEKKIPAKATLFYDVFVKEVR
jgi:FKBP-type peptidyl-prolyl cis-trans isomerase